MRFAVDWYHGWNEVLRLFPFGQVFIADIWPLSIHVLLRGWAVRVAQDVVWDVVQLRLKLRQMVLK